MALSDESGKYRQFALTSFAIDHFTSVVVLTGTIIILGVISYITLPKEAAPEIVIPNIFVSTTYQGVAPKDIETLVTRPLEEELNTISDVQEITSVSAEGYSQINVEFVAGMDMNEALQKVRERVDVAKAELPEAADDPRIIEINMAEFPIVQVNIAGDYGLVRLREVAEDLQDQLEQIPSVLEVSLSGGLEREILVAVDLSRLKFYDLAFKDVIDAIRNENVTIPGGSIDVGGMKYLVRVPGEFTATELIAGLVITTRHGQPIYIRDVADVDFGFKERDTYARLDDHPVVSLGVKKRSGENIIQTAQEVRRVIERVQPGLPPGTVIKLTSDQSEWIKAMVDNLENSIIFGLLLVVLVLLFFMGVRNAFFVGLAIPLSMLLSFSILQLVGITMNMVVLFSLILALGMLVDNAIVVLENIYRFRELGWSKIEAAKLGTGEVAMPIVASTATTLAAFLPLTFWPGIVGEFMKYLPLTLIITLSSSLFVGLVVVPTLCSAWLVTEDEVRPSLTGPMKSVLVIAVLAAFLLGLRSNPLTAVLLAGTAGLAYLLNHYFFKPVGRWFVTRVLGWILKVYERLLRWALGHRFFMVASALVAMVTVVIVFSRTNSGVEFFPEGVPPADAYIQMEAPLGTNIEQTNAVVLHIEAELKGLPGVADFESVQSTAGYSSSGQFGGGQGSHLATIIVHFLDFEDRAQDSFKSVNEVKSMLSNRIAGGEFTVEIPGMGPPTGKAVNLEISGEDADKLKRLGDEVVGLLERSPIFAKLDGLENDMADARPELEIKVDREKAALYGLNTGDVGNTVRSAINGTEASKFRDGKDEYNIVVRLAKRFRNSLDIISELTVVNEQGEQIPLSSIASWEIGRGSGDVNRKDLERVVTISAAVRPNFNANAVLNEVREELADFQQSLPAGYRLRYTGQQEEQQESEAFLGRSFLLALLLIVLILISQFDSVLKPLIILSAVMLSITGVLIELIVLQKPFSIIMTGVGVISLAGIVVNNAIVLMDYVDTLRQRDGLSNIESLVQGGLTRFRPVILTAITTVLGLIPLAIGFNLNFFGLYTRLEPELHWGGEQAAMWGPMALAVIFGLTLATFLTLILVPVIASILDDMTDFLQRNFLVSKQGGASTAEGAA